mmetsp:Transcript_274/g.698  ORF Transcript_274/g.698 Transcript_274/m.698 type:complete len:120 (-) Transcript_274:488-847(-)
MPKPQPDKGNLQAHEARQRGAGGEQMSFLPPWMSFDFSSAANRLGDWCQPCQPAGNVAWTWLSQVRARLFMSQAHAYHGDSKREPEAMGDQLWGGRERSGQFTGVDYCYECLKSQVRKG